MLPILVNPILICFLKGVSMFFNGWNKSGEEFVDADCLANWAMVNFDELVLESEIEKWKPCSLATTK